MSSKSDIVHIIDDDEASRQSLAFLLESAQIEVRTHASATMLLDLMPSMSASCVVTDVRMPGMSGTELLRRIKELGIQVPVIVITGHGDVPLAVDAMKIGAADFWRSRSTMKCCSQACVRRCASATARKNGVASAAKSTPGWCRLLSRSSITILRFATL